MAYNPRKSMLPQQQRVRKREEEENDPLILDDQQLLGCLGDLDLPVVPLAELQKPSALQWQLIFESFADLLLNVTRETVDPAMRAAADDVCGEYGDALMPADTRNLMAFFAATRELMAGCRIYDFSFADLYRPTPPRLRRIFSYLINFMRFRMSQLGVINEHLERKETARQRIETLYTHNQDMEARLDDVRIKRRAMAAQVAEKTRRNEELKKTLLELRSKQERVAERLEEAKRKKNELAAELQDKTATKVTVKQENAKLRPYVLQSPSALQANLTELGNKLASEKAQIDGLDRRARALQTSSDTFAVVSTDVASCISLLNEIGKELEKEEEENARKVRQESALTERGANVREIDRTDALLKRQLAKWAERSRTLRMQTDDKTNKAKDRMEELRTIHKKLTEERSEKSKDVERRRVRMEQTEKKMVDLKEKIENEVHSAKEEYQKMQSHIELYIKEMEQAT